jgi:hypothetical protein
VLVELNVTEQRYRAVLQVQAGVPVTEVADAFGVSRIARFKARKPEPLMARARRRDG